MLEYYTKGVLIIHNLKFGQHENIYHNSIYYI